jgi:predicted ATPase
LHDTFADADGPTIWYHLLETTQAYSYEKLKEAGETDAVRRRHAQRFLNVCQSIAALGADDALVTDQLRDY